MLYNKVINLIDVVETKNGYGEIVQTETETEVAADVESVGRAEFYAAQTAGFRPEVIFKIRKALYMEQPTIEYQNVKYEVIRAYSKDDELVELVCRRNVR